MCGFVLPYKGTARLPSSHLHCTTLQYSDDATLPSPPPYGEKSNTYSPADYLVGVECSGRGWVLVAEWAEGLPSPANGDIPCE